MQGIGQLPDATVERGHFGTCRGHRGGTLLTFSGQHVAGAGGSRDDDAEVLRDPPAALGDGGGDLSRMLAGGAGLLRPHPRLTFGGGGTAQ